MKTQICIILMTLIPGIAMAKLDLSESISESGRQQLELSAGSRANAKQVRGITSAPRQRIVEVEKHGGSYTAPTDEGFTKYEKESKNFSASHKAQMNRLDAELKGAK